MSKDAANYDAAQAPKNHVSAGFNPYDDYGPSPTLFCTPFAYAYNRIMDRSNVRVELASDPKSVIDPFPGMDVWVPEFAKVLCGHYDTERKLVEAVHPLLIKLFSDRSLQSHAWFHDAVGPVFEFDLAAECFTAHFMPMVYMMVEIKRGIIADALLQACTSYNRMLALEKVGFCSFRTILCS